MITHSPKKVFSKLDKSKLDKVQIVNTPVVKVTLSGEINKTEFGGDTAIVHYNRHKEIQHCKDKNNKRFRHLRRQQKNARCIALGDTFPDVIPLNREGERK